LGDDEGFTTSMRWWVKDTFYNFSKKRGIAKRNSFFFVVKERKKEKKN